MDAVNYLEKQSIENQALALKHAREALSLKYSARLADALILLEQGKFQEAMTNLTVVTLWWHIKDNEVAYLDGGHLVSMASEYAAAAAALASAARVIRMVEQPAA